MKKLCSVLLVAVLLAALSVSAFAASSASLTGPETVRSGDTITLSFRVNGEKLYGASGTLDFDEKQLTLTGTKQKVASPWNVEFNDNKFVAYDDQLSAPIDSEVLFTATFSVKDVETGDVLTVSCKDVKLSDGKQDAKIGTVSYRVSVAPPASDDNLLESLTVSNAKISPAFSPSTTRYTASVPFATSKLSVKATAHDAKAKVTVANTALEAGKRTNVTVTVTAENGTKKTYTIAVAREADPNYVAGSNNRLQTLEVEDFFLSPAFNPDVDSYVVWLPFETLSVAVKAAAQDGKAEVRVEGGENLTAGADNPVKIHCVAEDGTEKVYTILAKRAADPSAEGTDASTDSSASDLPQTTDGEGTVKTIVIRENYNAEYPVWVLILVAVGGIFLGAGAMFLASSFRRMY